MLTAKWKIFITRFRDSVIENSIICTKKIVGLLTASQIWLADGTFKTAPPILFAQVYTYTDRVEAQTFLMMVIFYLVFRIVTQWDASNISKMCGLNEAVNVHKQIKHKLLMIIDFEIFFYFFFD